MEKEELKKNSLSLPLEQAKEVVTISEEDLLFGRSTKAQSGIEAQSSVAIKRGKGRKDEESSTGGLIGRDAYFFSVSSEPDDDLPFLLFSSLLPAELSPSQGWMVGCFVNEGGWLVSSLQSKYLLIYTRTARSRRLCFF